MNSYRIYVEKLTQFQVEAKELRDELNLNLGLSLSKVRYLNVYDVFNCERQLLEEAKYRVFGETVTDNVTDSIDLDGKKYIATEYLPGQFDMRASSAVDCVKLIDPTSKVEIRSAKLYIFEDTVTEEDINRIKKYLINAVESREKDLNVLDNNQEANVLPVNKLEGFINMSQEDLYPYCKENGLAMNADDLACVVEYFKNEGRDPYETELRILDTYWSDHCRHTTFNTELTEITIDESFIKNELEEALDLYYKVRKELNRENKSLCLMDLACIGARYLKKIGKLDDLEESEENNACSIFVTVDVDGKDEKWLLQFKNETHYHPTEIEPFGGASTCLGGAIRDPLSGRAYVYQAMRVTGAGNIYADVKDTMVGKLPQRIITTKAAAGYSSYGNQIGLATTHVREIYHDDYVAKRLEVGAVVGAVKASEIRRESPAAGDVVLLLGGRTGRDGIGGATGSSKEHNTKSIDLCSSEVQKGNAPEERKISRLFRRPEVTRLIKKSNDFGAGGVSVAIGELADGLRINLDKVPTKYSGLNATELAISESQERMAVVIEAKDVEEFMSYCASENIEVNHVADVTAEARLVMNYKGETIVNISREFIDSAGAKHYAQAEIEAISTSNPFVNKEKKTIKNLVKDTLTDNNVVSQKGLIEMFDATIGTSTVLMPFGGKYQKTETQVSCQKLPVLNAYTNTASIMAYGYNPFITKWSPFHGSQYAIIEAISKVVAAGARYDKMRFSYQEYFEKMNNIKAWGKPLAALLGALKMQLDFNLPSIGGKDSMSGTYNNINVPPMLMAFGITTVNANNVISPEFKKPGSKIYLIKHNELKNFLPNVDELKKNFDYVSSKIEDKTIISAYALGFGGVVEALAKMSLGNQIGFTANYPTCELNAYNYGSIVVETDYTLDSPNAVLLGYTTGNSYASINNVEFKLSYLEELICNKFNQVYKDKANNDSKLIDIKPYNTKVELLKNKDEVLTYIPVFPGTNCDYDTAKAFLRAGSKVKTSVFKNLTENDIKESIVEMAANIDACDIFVLSGGFSAGDEPDGSGKFIANVLNQETVKNAIHRLLDRKGLILGICNGFQALVKSGLLPYGRLGTVTKESPTLFRNDINRHVSQMVSTKVMTNASPWLASYNGGEVHKIAVSHGEGKFVVSDELAQELIANGQIAFQYVDDNNDATIVSPFNPNGSNYAIEGIISKDGLILGKMGHSERIEDNLYKNISGNKYQDIFKNAVAYFKK